ncbi:MAG: patatin-like phospholipase family protein [Flavobacteriales bacterium]
MPEWLAEGELYRRQSEEPFDLPALRSGTNLFGGSELSKPHSTKRCLSGSPKARCIEGKAGSKDITFLQLYQKHQSDPKFKELVVTATSLNHQDALIFSYHNYPNMRIVDAVRASMAIPYYFEPMIIDSVGHPIELDQLTASGDVCVDGGFTTNFPIYIFDEAPYFDKQTLGFRIDNDEQIESDKSSKEIVDQQVASLQDFSVAFYYLIKETMNRYMLTEEDWARTVSVSDADIGPKVKKLSEEEKQKLIQSGANAYLNYK